MTDASNTSVRAAFRSWFGLSEGQAEVLSALYAAEGHPLQARDLADHAGSKASAMGVLIFRLRQALETEAIDFKPGEGYALSEVGREECRAAITQVRLELLAAYRGLTDASPGSSAGGPPFEGLLEVAAA